LFPVADAAVFPGLLPAGMLAPPDRRGSLRFELLRAWAAFTLSPGPDLPSSDPDPAPWLLGEQGEHHDGRQRE
jgi:hypothetical protein